MKNKTETIPFNSSNWHEISSETINEAVRLLVNQIGMSGGSINDMDLYLLVRNYLKRPEVRQSINQKLTEHNCI